MRDAEVETQFVRWAEVRAKSEPWTMTRTEHKLVLELKAHLEAGGQVVVSKRIPIPDGEWIVNDLFNVTRHQLSEAKNEASRAKMRMAIGQVLDYRRFVTPSAAGAVLTPEEPTTDLLELLAKWDSPRSGGRATGSPTAEVVNSREQAADAGSRGSFSGKPLEPDADVVTRRGVASEPRQQLLEIAAPGADSAL